MQEPSRAEVISQIREWFRTPNPDYAGAVERIHDGARDLALLIEALAPSSRERSLAFTKLQEAVMWAAAAVARAPESPGDG